MAGFRPHAIYTDVHVVAPASPGPVVAVIELAADDVIAAQSWFGAGDAFTYEMVDIAAAIAGVDEDAPF